MKVSSFCGSGFMDVRIFAESLSDELYSALFAHAIKTNQVHILNNNLLVNLGLLKVSIVLICLLLRRKIMRNLRENEA